VLIQDFGADLFAEVYLRLPIIPQVSRELDHVEIEAIQRGAHSIKPVFGLHDYFMKTMGVRPFFLLLRQGAIPALPPPFLARPANPAVENSAIRKFHDIAEFGNQF